MKTWCEWTGWGAACPFGFVGSTVPHSNAAVLQKKAENLCGRCQICDSRHTACSNSETHKGSVRTLLSVHAPRSSVFCFFPLNRWAVKWLFTLCCHCLITMWWGLKEFRLSILSSSKLVQASLNSSVMCACVSESVREISSCCHAKCKVWITCVFVYIKNTSKCSTANSFWKTRKYLETLGCSCGHWDLGSKSVVSPHSFWHMIH